MFGQSYSPPGVDKEDAAQGWNKRRSCAPTDGAGLAMAERWPDPAWLVNSDLRVEHANGSAVRMAAEPGIAPVIRLAAGRLQAIGTADANVLRQGVAQARQAGYSETIALLPTRATTAARSPEPAVRRARLRFVELSSQHLQPSGGLDPSSLLLVLEFGLGDEALEWLARLASHFCLTRTELKVLWHVAHSGTPAEIAAALGVGTPTVRTHLRSLFNKTGSRRQADLVRLVWA